MELLGWQVVESELAVFSEQTSGKSCSTFVIETYIVGDCQVSGTPQSDQIAQLPMLLPGNAGTVMRDYLDRQRKMDWEDTAWRWNCDAHRPWQESVPRSCALHREKIREHFSAL